MKRATAVLLALFGAFVIALSRGTEMQPIPAAGGQPQPAPRHPSFEPASPLERDPFQFGVVAAEAPRPASGPAAMELEASAPPPALPRVRLVGFVQQAGRLRAALVVDGEILLLSVGDAAGGYTILAADETTGVQLRGPGGEELALEVPE